MSKSKNNYPDPWIFIDKYGVDALRLYLMSSTLMKGEDSNFSEKAVQDIASKIVGRLFNVLAFYELYRDKSLELDEIPKSENVLDKWIMSRLSQTINEVTKGMDSYDMAEATRPIDPLVDDLSTWYLRRSRERMKDGDKEAKTTLYFVLKNIAKLLAPFAPFSAESIWLRLKNEKEAESVHLIEWPKGEKVSTEIISNMKIARDIVSVGLKERQIHNIPVRQPLRSAVFGNKLDNVYLEIIKDELNVKEIKHDLHEENLILDFEITEELKQEGQYRELVRALQDMRKDSGLIPSDVISLSISTSEQGKKLIESWQKEIQKTVGIKEIKFEENTGVEVKINELVFVVSIQK